MYKAIRVNRVCHNMWVEWEQWADNGYGGQIWSVDKGSRQNNLCLRLGFWTNWGDLAQSWNTLDKIRIRKHVILYLFLCSGLFQKIFFSRKRLVFGQTPPEWSTPIPPRWSQIPTYEAYFFDCSPNANGTKKADYLLLTIICTTRHTHLAKADDIRAAKN